MTAVTAFGLTADPEELREIAALADAVAGPYRELRDRLGALPGYVLTEKTLASPPDELAARLREVAVFLERRRQGIPFGKPA